MSTPPEFAKRCEIRWRDMDAFRHVNNSVYLTYLEETRDEWFLDVLATSDVRLLDDFVLARCAIDYRSPLTQDDVEAEIRVHCTRVGGSSIGMTERIYSVLDGRLAAEAESVVVFYDQQTGTSRPLTDFVRGAFEARLG